MIWQLVSSNGISSGEGNKKTGQSKWPVPLGFQNLFSGTVQKRACLWILDCDVRTYK